MWQDDVIRVAMAQVGFKEGPNNDTPFGRAYGKAVGQDWNHQAYCAMLATWCFAEAGHPLPEMQAPGFSGFASAHIGLQYCRKHKLTVLLPERGDLVFFDWNTDGHIDHVGIVLGVNPDGTVAVFEGNVGKPQGNYIRIHQRDHLIFARPVPTTDQVKGPCWLNNLCPV